MSVHYMKTCTKVQHIVCMVPTESKWNSIQPRLVIQGHATEVEFVGPEGDITAIIR